MLLRVKADKMVRRGDGQEGTMWQYTVGYPVATVLEEDYFVPASHNLIAGDEIRVVRRVGGRITEYVDLMVVACEFNPPHITVEVLTEPREFPQPDVEEAAAHVFVEEIHVPEDCEVLWKGPARGFEVTGVSGEVYASTKDKEHAQSIARGDLPIPAKEAA